MPVTLNQICDLISPIHCRLLMLNFEHALFPIFDGKFEDVKDYKNAIKSFKVLKLDYQTDSHTAVIIVDLLTKKEADMIEKINAYWGL